MRDWTKTLRRASYRGVPFWVSLDELTGGKRIAQHKYAGGRIVFKEEMGLDTSVFNITGYLIGDSSDVEAAAFVAALQAPGPGLLRLPISGGQMATMQTFGRLWEKDQMGTIAVSVSFLPEVDSAGVALGLADVLSAVAANISAAVSGFGRLF